MTHRFQSIAPIAPLSTQVADALQLKIRNGSLKTGAKLPTETELAVQFGVSRTVVREAVARLKSQSLVTSRQGSGVFVSSPGISPLDFDTGPAVSRQAVIQMAEVRRALEAEVAGLAAQRGTASQRKKIRQAFAALEKAVSLGSDGVELDVDFHRCIADAAGNPFLSMTLDYLRQLLHGTTRVTRANEARRSDFSKQVRLEHEAIVAAIEERDGNKARKAGMRHMDNAIKRIEQADPGFWEQEGIMLASPLLHSAVSS